MKAATVYAALLIGVGSISIHAAREGGDTDPITTLTKSPIFQSTPPVKAATMPAVVFTLTLPFQSTPPVKAATCKIILPRVFYDISIHAAREGGDDIL